MSGAAGIGVRMNHEGTKAQRHRAFSCRECDRLDVRWSNWACRSRRHAVFVPLCLRGQIHSVAGEGDLADVDAAEGEAGLAVAEVVAPQAAEAPVEAERRD